MRAYGFDGINLKRRWTQEEELALLAGDVVDRNATSRRVKRWRLSGGKTEDRVRKAKETQVTNWLLMDELESVRSDFVKKGISFEVRERNGKYAIFRKLH